MKKTILILLAAILILAGCSGTAKVEIDGIQYEADATSIDLPQGTSIEHYEALKEVLPESSISWQVPFQGGYISNAAETVAITSATEDMDLLTYFPDLKTLDASGCGDIEGLARLQRENPGLEVVYTVTVAGEEYPSDTTELGLESPELSELAESLPYLPKLETVHLTEPQGDPALLSTLQESCPDVSITWEKTAFGEVYASDVTELDLSEKGLTFDDAEAMEAELVWFPDLDLVFFGDVSVDNDTMAAYRERQAENYKVVWNIRLNYQMNIRSDATYFMPRKFYMTVIDRDLTNLKYFNDMVTVDLGHMHITHCEWLAGMPKLQYLILADTPMSDISPVANCKELIYFEIFDTAVRDYTPLLECDKLQDLNMCWTDGSAEVIAQLKSLKRLWWWGTVTRGPMLSDQEQALLLEALPDCEIVFRTTTSTGSGWRQGELYYKMRDNLGMEYMK